MLDPHPRDNSYLVGLLTSYRYLEEARRAHIT